MGLIEIVWHVANFFLPAVAVGAIASLLAKGLWRSELRGIAWLRLFGWSATVSAAALVVGLIAFGHDGRMATYAAMVAGCALALWRVGFARRGWLPR